MAKNGKNKGKKNNSKGKKMLQNLSLQELVDLVGPLKDVTYYMSVQALQSKNVDDQLLEGFSDRKRAEIVTDRIAFAMLALDARMIELEQIPEQDRAEREKCYRFIKNAQRLLSDINKDIYYYDTDEENPDLPRKIVHLNSRKLVLGESSKKQKRNNLEKIEAIEAELSSHGSDFAMLLGNVDYLKLFNPPICKEEVGKMLKDLMNKHLNNSPEVMRVMKKYNKAPTVESIEKDEEVKQDMDNYSLEYRRIFMELIKANSEEIDIDALLLMIAHTNISLLDSGYGKQFEIEAVEKALKVFEKRISKSAKIKNAGKSELSPDTVNYSYNDMVEDLSRFSDGYYLTKRELPILRESVLEGTIDITRIDKRNIKILNLSAEEVLKIRESNYSGFALIICGDGYISDETKQEIIKMLPDEEIEWLYTKIDFPLESVKNRKDLILKMFFDGNLRPKDISTMYKLKIISISDLKKRLLQMQDEKERYAFIYGNFSNKEDSEIFDQLIQLLSVENLQSESKKGKKHPGPKPDPVDDKKENPIPSKLRWQLISKLDDDMDYEVLSDGHFIIKFKKRGKVLIERMLKPKKGKTVDSYGEASFGMTPEEFEKYKSKFMSDDGKRINLTNLVSSQKVHQFERIVHYPSQWGDDIAEFVLGEAPDKADKMAEVAPIIEELQKEMENAKEHEDK